ncbi:hypothetical protein [Streptomyces sp. NPDC058683]|uniref:hypothetical protein n=1 Tax=Streptomyces sp. NPDC058683 TaxID=3346597 RepID=UPI00366926A5
MRTDDPRLLTAAVVLLLTGAFLIPPAKAAPQDEHRAFGTPGAPPSEGPTDRWTAVRTGPVMGSAVPPSPWLRRHGVPVPP